MSYLLLEFPERIETDRLYIRPCQPGDGPTLYDSIQASREELKKWLPFANKEQTVEEIEEGVRKSFSAFITREDFRLHIYRKEDDVFIGSTGLHRINWSVRKFEIGYWCDTRHHKKGYISEAVEALTKFAFETLEANRVEIRCDPDNISSKKIPERLNFTLEGILRNDSMSADGTTIRDTCVFSKIREIN